MNVCVYACVYSLCAAVLHADIHIHTYKVNWQQLNTLKFMYAANWLLGMRYLRERAKSFAPTAVRKWELIQTQLLRASLSLSHWLSTRQVVSALECALYLHCSA